MPATPLPQPRSSTVCPRTQAGSACTTRASSWAAGQTVAQKGTACGAPHSSSHACHSASRVHFIRLRLSAVIVGILLVIDVLFFGIITVRAD